MHLNQRALTIEFNTNPACYTLSFKGSRDFKIKIHTVSVSFSCLAIVLLSASWHRKLWRDPSSVSSHQHFQNGKDFGACLLQQKHHYNLQKGRGKSKNPDITLLSTITCNGNKSESNSMETKA